MRRFALTLAAVLAGNVITAAARAELEFRAYRRQYAAELGVIAAALRKTRSAGVDS